MTRILYMPEMATDDPVRSLESKHLNALLYGGRCVGYEEATFDESAAVALPSMPDNAQVAIVYLEADAGEVGEARVARYREDGVDPTAAAGMPLGDDSIIDVSGRDNLEAFRIIAINAATHTIRVQYYGQM